MDPASVPVVPPAVELAIYGYFALVAMAGCSLYGRLWFSVRHTQTGDSVATTQSNN
ncbi:hypothetical protein [Natronobacterium gregoryi]|uniref:Uncharacterized protein n=2 Tax=Natronobacterium gregoryi TaxID=44930 RepID=L0AF86_NATGS|nr:hypothetical protein [Natronobacterium gregoryi]AFZ72501.1 hypothetical protein Natgr_1279 [Natronobacterium gregoryi SP2]SFI76998.1 hypothetical protein SAMN05443661_10563 [Natronobacterium gregoryi]